MKSSDVHLLQAALSQYIILKLFTAIVWINPATAPNVTSQPLQLAHICHLFTFIEKMYMILQKLHNPSVKKNILRNSMYMSFLPSIAYFFTLNNAE